MELLKTLYCIHSKSGKEDKMLEFLINWLFANFPKAEVEMDDKGNLYVTKGESETYPCIVAHVDQVQSYHSDDFEAIETTDIIFGYSKSMRRYEGLGADDKNGVWIALQCLLKYDVLKVAFFVGEEIGCVGSNAADMDFFNDCRFVVQCDRRGFDDIIHTAGSVELCSDDFLNDCGYQFFGYTKQYGMMTDVMTLKRRGLSVACINLSCGYYEPHTDSEFTIKYDLENCLYFVQYIIENCTKVYEHKYEYKPSTTYYGYRSSYYNAKGYGGSSSYNGYRSHNETVVEKKPVGSNILPFFDNEKDKKEHDITNVGDYDDFYNNNDDDASWLDEVTQPSNLSQEMRDELYDIIYALLNDCPSASCDMVYSALKQTYPNLSWDDARTSYHEVRYDMKKYMSMC